jgi:flagellar hook-length control protein FliK
MRDDEASIKDQTPVAAGLKELMALLEEAGLNGSSAEQMMMPGAGLTLENTSGSAGKGQNPLVALKQLIGEIQPHDLKPGSVMSTGLERLRLFIADALAAGSSAPGGGKLQGGLNLNESPVPGGGKLQGGLNLNESPVPGGGKPQGGLNLNESPAPGGGKLQGGLNLNESPGSVDSANWLKGIIQGQEKAVSINAAVAGEGAGGEKSAEILSAVTRPAMETENVLKVPGPLKTVENSPIAVQSENPEKTNAAKLSPDIRTAAEANETVRELKFPEILPGKAGNSERSLSSADSRRPSGGQPLQENSMTGDSLPVSKLINDAQVAKENPLIVDAAAGDNAGGKVVKIEAATNDNGQLTSQVQTSEKAPESVSSPKETEAGQRELRTRTMEQIVRRAVIQVRNGQHEARIDLKPDFLGHVRMQVITENQQVTVKILTEFGFVKEMIENNIQQLKADLQHQGLEVDKLDVSVSRDANGNKHQQENMEHARKLRHENKSGDRGNAREEQEKQPDRPVASAEGLSTVDYFA